MNRLRAVGILLALVLLAAACTPNPQGSDPRIVEAVIARSNNLFVGSDVRVLGMRVGLVESLASEGPHVLVRMAIKHDVSLPADVRAVVRPVSLLGERYVQLDPPHVDGPTHPEGERIPLERTVVPAETDEVLESFERFLEGLDPDTLAELVEVVAQTIEGQGDGLNQLLDRGATTMRVLADSSEDLMASVRALGQLNASLATRDQRLGDVLTDWSTVVRTLAEEGDQIVDGMGNLRRLVRELRPLLDDHAQRLVGDLEILTTTLSTAERNVTRVGDMVNGSADLFEGAGRAFDYENARLRLLNHGEDLEASIRDRMTNRLVGLCFRLGLPVCEQQLFWTERLPEQICLEGAGCADGQVPLSEALLDALEELPPEARDRLLDEMPVPGTQDDPDDGEDPDDPGDGESVGPLPLPDPRVSSSSSRSQPHWLDRLVRLFGGGR